MKFCRIVLQVNTHRLTESDFGYDVIHTFNMVAMTSFHAAKCCRLASGHNVCPALVQLRLSIVHSYFLHSSVAKRDKNTHLGLYTVLVLQWLGVGLVIEKSPAGSTPGRGAIKSTRPTQPSIPPGKVNRVPACMAGVRRGPFTCVGWKVTV